MTITRQLGFAYGQVGKIGYGRVDQNFYALGLRTLKNALVERAGVLSSRSGTIFCGWTIDSTKKTRLIPFIFSPDPDQAYSLAFSHQTMRVLRNREPVTEASKNITGATQANPCELTVVAHAYATGDHVLVGRASVVGMKELNGREYIVTSTGANTFTLKDVNGTAIDSTAFTAYVSGGTVARVYQIRTPYSEADLPDLYFEQSADVVIITHPSHWPHQLVRTGHASWTISFFQFVPNIARPAQLNVLSGGAGANVYNYAVHAIDAITGEESLGATTPLKAISGITAANPPVVTANAHGFVNGDRVVIDLVTGMDELNKREFVVANAAANTFELKIPSDGLTNVDATGYKAYVALGFVGKTSFQIAAAAAPTGGAPHIITWVAAAGAGLYRVYRFFGGVWAFIGETSELTFSDTGTPSPDPTLNAPVDQYLFDSPGKWPAFVGSYQGRKLFSRPDTAPETFYASRTSSFGNFTLVTPPADNGRIIAPLPGREVNEIKHLIDLQKLIVLTSGSEMIANGDGSGVLTPTAVNARTVAYNGVSDVRPIIVDNVVVFVQERGALLLGIAFSAFDKYDTDDLSLHSIDLLEGHTVVEMAYQKAPHSVVWILRDDGVLLSFTYIPKQDIKAWAIHETDGLVESICCIPEADQTALYMVVKRTIGGTTQRYVEVLAPRQVSDLVDYVGMDAARTYDGRHRADGVRVRIQGGTTWLAGEALVVHADGGTPFLAQHVGDSVFVYGSEEVHGQKILIRCTITGFVDTANVNVVTNYDVPVGLQTVYTDNWDLAVKKVHELWQLEGKKVAILRDGDVYASPNNPDVTAVATVANGKIELDEAGGVVTVGLPFLPDVEPLDMDTVQGEPLIGKKKIVKVLDVFVKDTVRGIWAGPNPPSDDAVDPLEGLEQFAPADVDDPVDEPLPLITDVIPIPLQSRWNSNGRVFIRQVDPVPMTILAIAPRVTISKLRG